MSYVFGAPLWMLAIICALNILYFRVKQEDVHNFYFIHSKSFLHVEGVSNSFLSQESEL